MARRLKLSTATVSEALRDSPRVKAETKERIQQAAEKAGYKLNPLVGAAFSAIRRGTDQSYRGTLALVDSIEDGKAELMLFHREIVAGARQRAAELGCHTEIFWLGEHKDGLSNRRLSQVLTARGISGIILLPFHSVRDMSDFDFSRVSAVQMDHCLVRPQLHTVLPDHYVSIIHALERLTERGYSRIGLCVEQRKDLRLKNKWSAGFWAYFHQYVRPEGIPPLFTPQLSEEKFSEWYRANQPDLVVGHRQIMVEWLRKIGVRVPQDVGFFNLNLTERIDPCAGLDLQPSRLGMVAVNAVFGMLTRYERGVPETPMTIAIEALWRDGPTIDAAVTAPSERKRSESAKGE